MIFVYIFCRVADLLLGGAVMNKIYQPFEAHIPYLLQVGSVLLLTHAHCNPVSPILILRHIPGSTLAQVMACCLLAPRQNLNRVQHIDKFSLAWHPNYQSGTKPNLVAKIWPPNLVTICAWLPKLVANVSSNFHHLVNAGLAVGSFFKWLPITVAHTCKLDAIWMVYISPIGNGSIRLQSPLTHYAWWNFTSSGAGHFSELAGAHT